MNQIVWTVSVCHAMGPEAYRGLPKSMDPAPAGEAGSW